MNYNVVSFLPFIKNAAAPILEPLSFATRGGIKTSLKIFFLMSFVFVTIF
jgi:hypothetical protein